jgi:hypothetical protein
LDELYTYEEDHSNALCPIDEERSGSHMGELVEIQPMTAAEIRQYFDEHAKKTHELAFQLSQLMIVTSPPQTMQLAGTGMVSHSRIVLFTVTQS